MARDPYRASVGDLGRGERWDRERFSYERDRDRYGDERVRYEEDDAVYLRDYREPQPRYRPRVGSNQFERRPPSDDFVRERRVYYDDPPPPRRARSPPTAEFDRKVVIEKERVRSPSPRAAPPRRPTMLRRQSSLDTFDRLPPRFYEQQQQQQQERYGPPARREDYRPPPNVPIPLPRTRGLPPPPPRRYGDRYDDIGVSEPDRYGDDDFHPYPERVREREVIHERRRDRSRDSRTTAHTRGSHRGSTVRSSSRSSSTSSRSSSSSGGTTVKSEYPKKGKTRIPARLVSRRALEDLGYPFVVEGNTIVVQKALGQENIDDLLKLSEDYKKTEMEMTVASRPPPPPPMAAPVHEVVEERREEFVMAPGPPGPPPMLIRNPPRPPAAVEVVKTSALVRDVSPSRSSVTSFSHGGPIVIDARPREVEEVALVRHEHLHHRRHRSHSRGGRELVAAERLSNGELVLFEERVEKVEAPRRGVRIEKDKKGRMSISVPKNR